MSKSIEVNDLNVYYGDFLAVEGVSLDIQPRSVTAFIGPSGCGKSTFLRTLNRMHEVIPGALGLRRGGYDGPGADGEERAGREKQPGGDGTFDLRHALTNAAPLRTLRGAARREELCPAGSVPSTVEVDW